jgi:hypothetical protein
MKEERLFAAVRIRTVAGRTSLECGGIREFPDRSPDAAGVKTAATA